MFLHVTMDVWAGMGTYMQVYISGDVCMQYVKKKTRKKEAVHQSTISLAGQLVKRWFERSDLTTLNKCWTEQRAGKGNKETGNDQAHPVYSKDWEPEEKRIS